MFGYTILGFGSGSLDQAYQVDYLVVGGGGGGSQEGAGGAGGLVYNTTHELEAGDYTVTIGAGGAWNSNPGANSVGLHVTGLGGGGGDGNSPQSPIQTNTGWPGGSGGGGGGNAPAVAGEGIQTTGAPEGDSRTYGFGNDGGRGLGAPHHQGGGGGGAGGAATPGPNAGSATITNKGGVGKDLTITGASVGYAGGGGGSAYQTIADAGAASHGGGTGGVQNPYSQPIGGAVNTGGGSGAMWNLTANSGGSGVVVISYPTTFAAITACHASHVINGGTAGSIVEDTSSRSDYRVYKFTAGDGSITFG